MRIYIKLVVLIFLACIGGVFLTSVWHEIQVFGWMTKNELGEDVGVLTGVYPIWFYIATGASIAAIFWAVVITVMVVRDFRNGSFSKTD